MNWLIDLIEILFCDFSQNPAMDTPNQSEPRVNHTEALIGPVVAAGLWLVTLLGVSRPRFRSMWKITKQYLNKSIQSIWK